MTRRLVFIGFDDITSLDLIGPLEAFAAANQYAGRRAYETLLVSRTGSAFRGENGVRLCADAAFAAAPACDTLLIPGGCGLRDPRIGGPVAAFVKQRAGDTRRIASICTGIFALAETGLMNGRRATTHWRYAEMIAARHPLIRLEPDAIHIRDGKFFTSAGITAGIDLALSLIADDLGEKTSLAVARELVVYFKRPGGQSQFSEPLQFQSRAGDGFSDLAAWILRNLKGEMPVALLAARMNLGERHFSRRFQAVFGAPPARHIEKLRLDEARRRLASPRQTVESIAASIGYASADAFRRAFERRFGIAPSAYRKTLGGKSTRRDN